MRTDIDQRACDLAVYIIENQATVRAAANQFNANIVARYLGLKDQQEVEQKVEYIMKNPNE